MIESAQLGPYVRFAVNYLPLIIAVILHEIAHALVAERLGDPTARRLGRISLNPIRHIDPVMTVILPGLLALSGSPVIFGGAKPVPIDVRNFKNPSRHMAIVAAAGPLTNILLALFGHAVLYLAVSSKLFSDPSSISQVLLLNFLISWILINVALALFNLIPVPPLDGGRIVAGFLPAAAARAYGRLERYGLLIVFALLYVGAIQQALGPAIEWVFQQLPIFIEQT